MMLWKRLVLLTAWIGGSLIMPAVAQQMPHDAHRSAMSSGLTEPGQAIFGTVQEIIRRIESDTTVTWKDVDLEGIRQHLIDMHQVAMNVDVVYQHPIEGGVRIRVRPSTPRAAASLNRVLATHPTPLKHETGWDMTVQRGDGYHDVRVTTANPDEVPKIRGLGYISLLAHGGHHQQHHWMMATGQSPH